MSMFDRDKVVGTFRGFAESGMEFHADLVLPHDDSFQTMAMHGQFVLVQLEHEREAILGRITTISSQGRLVSPIGEDYATRAVRDQRPIPDELRERYLKYKVDIRILGVLRHEGDKHIFVPSHRRLPHVGAQVALLSDDLLAEIVNANDTEGGAVPIGYLAFGEFVYAGDNAHVGDTTWMQIQYPTIMPTFQIDKLVARRSFVFARAGFGKSNLVKLLFSALYKGQPTVDRRNGKAPVGTVIFDPDGEYFWPDFKGRPALCDVPHLRDKLVVFTNRKGPSDFYQSFVVNGVKLNIRELSPARVLGIALPPEKQEQQNVVKLKSLDSRKWGKLVDLIHREKYSADRTQVQDLLGLDHSEEAQTNAAIGNMTRVVNALHDPDSRLLSALKDCLAQGKLCVVDISQMRGAQGLQLAGVILSDIFEHNQTQFTEAEPKSIPTIAVIEEAQSVLGGSKQSEDGPFVSWVKEGRKYDLGALLITQQPGSLPQELLSQGDNFFVFHLLSQGDLISLKKANAHFSEDLLATLLNEPLVGSGIFWSSAPGTDQHSRPYPVSVRVLSFEDSYDMADPNFDIPAPDSFAAQARADVQHRRDDARAASASLAVSHPQADTPPADDDGPAADDSAIAFVHLRDLPEFQRKIKTAEGIQWGRIGHLLAEKAPEHTIRTGAAKDWGMGLVKEAMDTLYPGKWTRVTRPDPKRPGRFPKWIMLKEFAAEPEAETDGKLFEEEATEGEPPF
ncbi:ATP-binding protein [Streptomyces sp. SHP 1-2]|uniref:ATP-binding protein n=1 Tax=Streptomyces sp. SHP 1-2 TaxID=2769489 RepID=UPI00223805C5|nr:ATP-binding protein [Streptomyces sp. SHP 1-2]MCW5254539.1 ATP-binding protein [Streptomyces sp. SHP 1-2]